MAKSIPRPSILDDFEYLGAFSGERRWRSDGGKRLYTWDSLHGEGEVYSTPEESTSVLSTLRPEPG